MVWAGVGGGIASSKVGLRKVNKYLFPRACLLRAVSSLSAVHARSEAERRKERWVAELEGGPAGRGVLLRWSKLAWLGNRAWASFQGRAAAIPTDWQLVLLFSHVRIVSIEAGGSEKSPAQVPRGLRCMKRPLAG